MVGLIVLVAMVALTACCVVDLARATEVRSLSRVLWVVFCLVSMPLGGIIYLTAGKAWNGREVAGSAARWPMWRAH